MIMWMDYVKFLRSPPLVMQSKTIRWLMSFYDAIFFNNSDLGFTRRIQCVAFQVVTYYR